MSNVLAQEHYYGYINGNAVGIIMKELVRRAIKEIRLQQVVFDVKEKATPGKDIDFVTSADLAAQKMYVKGLQECFPNYGIVAEEDGLCQRPKNGYISYFSVDPLDGTKAFVRRQSHGIGTMLALRGHEGSVISAWVGDVMTQEIYGYRPDSTKAHRIVDYSCASKLEVDQTIPLHKQNLILRDTPESFPFDIKGILGNFKNYEIEGGSIGLTFARLWKGEVGGILTLPKNDTPWDIWPVIGISKQLGFQFFDCYDNGRFEQYEPVVSVDTTCRYYPRLVVHSSRVGEILGKS